MTYWVFTTQQDAQTAEQVILKLGSRALALREGYERDAQLRVIGKRVSDGATMGGATEHWSPVMQTTLGTWAIYAPQHSDLYADDFEDTPMTLAVGWGLDPDTVDWSAVATAVGLNPLTFDPAVEITLSGENWVRGAFVILGLAFVEMEDPGFPE